MQLRNHKERWGFVSIGLHWLTVIMVVSLCLAGLIMEDLPTGTFKIQVYSLHKSFGLTVLALTVFRLMWRLIAGKPEALSSIPAWQRLMATLTHNLMYLVLLLMPLSGWLYNSASGFPLKYFGLFKVPKLSSFDRNIKVFAGDAHETLFYVLALLLFVHALAALKHHYIDKDTTLTRMLPDFKKTAGAANE
jgi:cytochrome b561